jgi:ABC-type nitrate/sulfonate/bicarbonate transport system substrate-binding protein
MKRSGAIVSLAAMSAAAATPRAVRAQTKDKLAVGFPILDPTSEVLYASDRGFFDKAGLDVALNPLTNGAAITAAVASGTLDIGLGNALTVISAFKKGIPLTVVAPGAVNVDSAPSNVLLVAKSSPLKTAADLNGKIIGVSPLRAIGDIATSAWIDKNGGDSSTVHFIEVPFPQAAAVVTQGRADAAFCSEPFITQAKSTTRVFANPFTVLGDGFLVTAFFALSPWAQAHADLVARFAAVIRMTADWANKNPDLSAEILAKYSKMDVAVVKETIRSRFATVLSPAQFQPTIDAAAKYKLLDSPFPATQLIFPGK